MPLSPPVWMVSCSDSPFFICGIHWFSVLWTWHPRALSIKCCKQILVCLLFIFLIVSVVDFGQMKLRERKLFCHTDLAEAKSHGALCQWSYIFPHGKADIGVISISWQNSQKKKEEMSEFFPETHSHGSKGQSALFPLKSSAQVSSSSLEVTCSHFCFLLLFFFWCHGESGAFVICQRSMDSSQACPWVFLFWHPKAPALTEAWRGASRGEQWGQGLISSHSSPGPIPRWLLVTQKGMKGQRRLATFQGLGRTRPNGLCQLFTLTLSSPPSPLFPLKGHKKGISQKEMPELWRRCLCLLSFFFFSSPPLHYFQTRCRVLSFLRNGVLVADNRMSEEITRTTLLLPYQFTSSPELFQFSRWQTQKEFIISEIPDIGMR